MEEVIEINNKNSTQISKIYLRDYFLREIQLTIDNDKKAILISFSKSNLDKSKSISLFLYQCTIGSIYFDEDDIWIEDYKLFATNDSLFYLSLDPNMSNLQECENDNLVFVFEKMKAIKHI